MDIAVDHFNCCAAGDKSPAPSAATQPGRCHGGEAHERKNGGLPTEIRVHGVSSGLRRLDLSSSASVAVLDTPSWLKSTRSRVICVTEQIARSRPTGYLLRQSQTIILAVIHITPEPNKCGKLLS